MKVDGGGRGGCEKGTIDCVCKERWSLEPQQVITSHRVKLQASKTARTHCRSPMDEHDIPSTLTHADTGSRARGMSSFWQGPRLHLPVPGRSELDFDLCSRMRSHWPPTHISPDMIPATTIVRVSCPGRTGSCQPSRSEDEVILRTNEVSIDSSSVTFTRVAVAIVSKSGRGGGDWRCWVCRSEKRPLHTRCRGVS